MNEKIQFIVRQPVTNGERTAVLSDKTELKIQKLLGLSTVICLSESWNISRQPQTLVMICP